MSDFFGNLQGGGIRLPEARINEGGMLPPLNTTGYKNGMDGTADARINSASSLLGDVTPYAYGKSDRLTTQTAYLNTPHNIQKIIPQIMLPDCTEASVEHTFLLPHAVSDGDIAYAMRFVTRPARDRFLLDVHTYIRQGAAGAVDYICNITTVNYLLRGLQVRRTNPSWDHFATALGSDVDGAYKELQGLLQSDSHSSSEESKLHIQALRSKLAVSIFRDVCRPMGVVIGSDKQGGQHQGSNKAVTFPVDFVATVSIDGRNENLCNFWKCCDVNSGDPLLLSLAPYNTNSLKNTYNLNNHKYSVHKEFVKAFTGDVYQVLPITQHKLYSNSENAIKIIEQGYWHFAMSQKMHRMRNEFGSVTDIEQYHRGGLLQVTISPHFVRQLDIETSASEHTKPVATKFSTESTKMEKNEKVIQNRPIFMQNESHSKRKLEAASLKSYGSSKPSDDLKRTKSSFNPNQLSKSSFNPNQSSKSSFNPNQLSKSSFNPNQLSKTSFNPNQVSMSSFNPSQESMARFSSNTISKASFIPNQVSTASFECNTSSESNIGSKTAKLLETYSHDQPASSDIGFTYVNEKDEIVKDKNLKVVEKEKNLTANSASTPITSTPIKSTPITSAVPKGRIKATRIAADPSIADTSQKGTRL